MENHVLILLKYLLMYCTAFRFKFDLKDFWDITYKMFQIFIEAGCFAAVSCQI
jgi:hypothetical protein